MTREDAIIKLSNLKTYKITNKFALIDEERFEALDMAIKALEAQSLEPIEDVVALSFSDDIDNQNSYMTKDGNWHKGYVPMIERGEDNDD